MNSYGKPTRTVAAAVFGAALAIVAVIFQSQGNVVLAAPPDLEARLDGFMAKLERELGVLPGAGIAVVEGDQVLISKGYGIADLDTGEAFTADTYSYIASGTKAFVGLTVAILAERGELDLDAAVGPTYLKDLDRRTLGLFGAVTLRELLTHTHGLENEPLEFRTAYTGDLLDENVWRTLGQSSAAEEGKAFAYSNFGYVAASYVLQHHFKEDWRTIVSRTVLQPGQFERTTFRVSSLLEQSVAKPHQWRGVTRRIPLYKRDSTMHAAGGQYTTAKDMARWLLLNLNDGRIDGQQVLPEEAIRLIRAPLVTLEKRFYDFDRQRYGLGWYDSDYEGERLYHHFGAFAGYRAHISMMPRIGLGVAVLSNDLSPPSINLPDMIAAFVYDVVLSKEGAEAKLDGQIAALAERIAPLKGREMPTRPRNAPEDEESFAGDYYNEKWGVWSLKPNGAALQLNWGHAVSDLIYVERKGQAMLRFEVAENGYLARLVRNEAGDLTGFEFHGQTFSKK